MGVTVADIWRAARRAARTPRQLAWTAAYAVLAFGPAALMVFFTPSGTSALTAGADALGLLGLGILGPQLLLPARWGPLTSSFGTDTLIGLHRSLASAGSLFVLLHVVLLMVDDPTRLRLFEFWSAPTRARLAVVATLALVALSVTSLLRTRLRLSYEGWRRVHLALGLVLVVGRGPRAAGGPLPRSRVAAGAHDRVARRVAGGRALPARRAAAHCHPSLPRRRGRGRTGRRGHRAPPRGRAQWGAVCPGPVRVAQGCRPAARADRASVLVCLER